MAGSSQGGKAAGKGTTKKTGSKPRSAGRKRRPPRRPALTSSNARAIQLEALLEVLGRRARPGERPEEFLLDFGMVPDRELAIELAIRSGRPFTGLRDFNPEPELFMYIPVALAMTERVCPLQLDGDSLLLATAFIDPDLSSVHERFPSLTFDLVVAPRNEILEAVRAVATAL